MIRWKKMDRKLIVRDWNHNSPTWPKSFSRTSIVGNAITVWPIYDASIYLVFISLLQRVIFISGRKNWSGSLQNKLWWSNLVATLSSVSGYTLALRQFIFGCIPAYRLVKLRCHWLSSNSIETSLIWPVPNWEGICINLRQFCYWLRITWHSWWRRCLVLLRWRQTETLNLIRVENLSLVTI